MTVPLAARPTRSPSQPTARRSLADVQTKGSGLPNRYVIHAPEGAGKTTFAAQTPSPIFIQTKGETGLETLIDAGRLPEVPHFPEVQTFDELMGCIETLSADEHQYRTLVIDTVNGAERLCHELICEREFGNNWGKTGFVNYQNGYDVSLGEWRKLLAALDSLRVNRRMSIVLLCHTRVKPFRNPEGADYDRFAPDMHDKTWSLTHKWADAVLFVNFETFVNETDAKKKGKAVSSQARIMHTERHAAYDAKNRFGLPTEIDMGTNGPEAWANFMEAMKAGRASGKAGE